MAEYLLRQIGGDRFEPFSAGSNPIGHVHHLTIRVLNELFHIDASAAQSKSWHDLVGIRFDFVITVCDDAREQCPVFPGEPVTAHWGLPDPEKAEGTEEDRFRAYVQTGFQIHRRIELFAGLPMEKLDDLQRSLQAQQVHVDAVEAAAVV
jgi:protein-tyrosine-phosphatase